MSAIVTEPSPSTSSIIEPGQMVEILIDPAKTGPIRAELYGLEGLEAQARRLAAACVLAPRVKASSPLLKQFEEDGRALLASHRRIVADSDRKDARGLDTEWLEDNFHIVEDVLREIKKDLPGGYDAQLPKIADGPAKGYPRVHAAALALVAHTDSEVDTTRLERYLKAFQDVAPLTIGELWALPTMLRLVLIENLRRLADQMIWAWDERRRAESYAASLQASMAEGDKPPAPPEVKDGLSDPFVVRLVQLLRDQGPAATDVLERLGQRLDARGDEGGEVLRRENRRQSANQVSVANCVISLRLLSALDWNTFFEANSAVDAILRRDPAGIYLRQDFTTRDRYRRSVEEIARRSAVDESVVALTSIELASDGQARGPTLSHVGYYLEGRGLPLLRKRFRYRASGRDRLLGWAHAHPRTLYFGMIAAIWMIVVAAVILGAGGAGLGVAGILLGVASLLLPTSDLAVGMTNHLLTMLLPPRVLPKLDFREGIAEDSPTFVVMPSMLVRPQSASQLLERLEIHYLANPDARLRFALLTDFADAPEATMPEDQGFIADALARVSALNDRYASEGAPIFFLFHRRRIHNPSQGCWMGWERKRGKLSEFNRILRGDPNTSYTVISANPGDFGSIKYVITLDADTLLPRDSARRLVGAIAHPLNRARFDPEKGRVVEGYGVLQPRVSFHLTAASRSWFSGLLASSAGIDPYSVAVSDTYMDLFGIGSFTGKGIYDVDAFEAATGHTFPENQILSHDLIEGNYARCGLVTDVELFDDFPARYHAYARREHRWVRGDWQLLPWLGRSVPTPNGPRPNPLPAMERWKLLDNLRRSLVPPSLVLLLVLGWTVLPGSPWVWTLTALAVPFLPVVQVVLGTLISAIRNRTLSPLQNWRDSLPPTAGQSLMTLAFLADQARLMLDATIRTLHRLFVTRKGLLEWETAASTERRLGMGLAGFWLTMWPAPAWALILAALTALVRPSALPAAVPVLLAWFISPVVAYLVSRPKRVIESTLTSADRLELRRVARRTWHFFEAFVNDGDNWLPPDNFQEEPGGRIAHRTSPTNQGLLLLSTLSAHDLGYVSLRELLSRLEKTLDTFDRMDKHQGHFYNWYDTQSLRGLTPIYISTVDSGNLLGCLITLKNGLIEKLDEPIPGPRRAEGLLDALGVVSEGTKRVSGPPKVTTVDGFKESQKDLVDWIDRFEKKLAEPIADLLQWWLFLGECDWMAVQLLGKIRAVAGSGAILPDDLEPFAERLSAQVREQRAALDELAPWLVSLNDLAGKPSRPSEAIARLVAPASPAELAASLGAFADEFSAIALTNPDDPAFAKVAGALRESSATTLIARTRALADRAEGMAEAMDFRFLYKADRHLFSIGLNLTQGRLDGGSYDLMASECCLTSLLAVARGEAPRRHWFQLGRPFIRAAGRVGLLSWGGTMFEYMMPRLLMKSLPGTLLTDAQQTAIARQIEYGKQAGIPWGISESAFASTNADGDYNYQSHGVPGLGLKRGLDRDLVIAPYATALALPGDPIEVLANFRRIAAEGGRGRYGFYEAIDYTPERLPKGKRRLVARSYMAHHQGMSLVAMVNALLDERMPQRFHSEPMVRAVELLLQERIPRDATMVEPSEAAPPQKEGRGEGPTLLSRRLTTPNTPAPRTHLLSNGRYHVMVTNAGSGYSSCRGLDVVRFREDATREGTGAFVYVRDLASNYVWSAGYQPVGRPADQYEAVYSSDKATFRRVDQGIETRTEIAVSPEQMAEVRRVTISNRDAKPRELELTSYAEITLFPRNADLAHPAFGKLFLETEWLAGPSALLCRRRPRSKEQPPIWAVHVAAADPPSSVIGEVSFETDRSRFLGRGRDVSAPAALDPGASLSGATGSVLDPIVSLRHRIRLGPGESATVSYTLAVADSRDEAVSLADHYRQPSAIGRAFDLAWAHGQLEHRHHGTAPEDAHHYQRLASHLIYSGSALRAPESVVSANRQPQSGLWRHGISGDRAILLARIAEASELTLVSQVVAAHAFLRAKGLDFDLILLNEQPTSYFEQLNGQITDLIRATDSRDLIDKPGGIFLRKSAHMADEDRTLLLAAARVVLVGDRGPLAGQLDRIERLAPLPDPLVATGERFEPKSSELATPEGLQFDNGYGGFSADGREYCILVRVPAAVEVGRNGRVAPGPVPRPTLPPAPWINVVANPNFGFIVSETGAGYTWAGNSQAHRLTPWSNDPTTDPPGEALYLRDEETGEFWSPTPLPVPSPSPTVVRHGQGYTQFDRQSHGIDQSLTLTVSPDDPVKFVRLSLRNDSDRPRKLSATYYVEWVLGTTRDASAAQVVTEVDEETGALFARNAFGGDYSNRIAFVHVERRPRTVTADRTEFLGRHGSPATPAALSRSKLSGRVGATLDPCAAIQTSLELKPGESTEVTFLLGESETVNAARQLIARHRDPGRAAEALEGMKALWDGILSAIQVKTPDRALDLLLNRWLPYQVLSCRIWARSAFYQSGGAFGFRDQLQDTMALVYGAPQEARAQLLRSASRQFVEGDVQHWWHPPLGRGVRTHFSDDLLWLPYVALHYIETTGDLAILDDRAPFLKAPLLGLGQEDDYGLPATADEDGTLYEHCVRALDHAYKLGEHGLPLMGTGDWNDGMNRVGSGGKGESVWDAWFQLAILARFAKVAESRGDLERAARCRQSDASLRKAVEASAWDGAWYRRAYFDDGTPLGSIKNDECQIDSIAQTWAVISGAGDPARSIQAMQAVTDRLVKVDDGLILLFTPPFDKGTLEPGYIKGYVPGIRENGGQYTHAATWAVLADALLGRGTRAVQLFHILNPIHHANSIESANLYKVEPYVVAADVYGLEPHVGRGGWTWYTGSASWLYRVGVEAILGIHLRGDHLEVDPCISAAWPGFEVRLKYRSASYRVVVENPKGVERGVESLSIDGEEIQGPLIPLVDDGGSHEIRVVLGGHDKTTAS